MRLLRLPSTTGRTGRSRSGLYDWIASGLFTQPVKISERSSSWPAYEVNVISSARVAGWTDDEIKHLVLELHALRERIPGLSDPEIQTAVTKIVSMIRPADSPPAAAA